jgi:superfamily II DNA or RNA helicase
VRGAERENCELALTTLKSKRSPIPESSLSASTNFMQLFATLDADPNRRGRQFEELCQWYLLNDPVYRAQIKQVWMWDDWPGRWGEDAGIDLVAEAKDGKLWAIQAKAYNPDYSIKKSDIDSFLSESARAEFEFRLLIASTNRVARLGERAMSAAEKPVGEVLLHDLEQAEVSWPSSIKNLHPSPRDPNQLRPHQREAIEAIKEGFKNGDRGQVVMACGTGKTLVALRASEALKAERTLVLVPSLSLVKQAIGDWLTDTLREFEFLPVCSDDTVRMQDQMVGSITQLGLPATGNPSDVADFLNRPGPSVVFSTYQSSPVVADAMELTGFDFDLVVADEAHRCAGPATSDFATILDEKRIRARKRMFMTATPRYFTGRLKREASEADLEIVSMDDDERFGGVLYKLPFGEAIERDLLCDYRVLIIGVNDETYRRYAEEGQLIKRDEKEVSDARSLAAQIGVAKAIRRFDLHRLITFHSRVKSARDFAGSLPRVVEWMPPEERPSTRIWADSVSGKMSSGQRETRLNRLRKLASDECGVLSNARCLSEGVNVPTLDGVAFIDPKSSAIDITQAVGRAIRLSEDKDLGTIIIPVFIDDSEEAEQALSDSRFKPVWDVVRALREHDPELGEALDELRRDLGRRTAGSWSLPEKIVLDLPSSVGESFGRSFKTRIVDSSTSSFEFTFGLLTLFAEATGHARVPEAYFDPDTKIKLGTWVTTQRTAFRNGTLERERIQRLDSVQGWVWDPRSDDWEEAFECLATFAAREGHARVPDAYSDPDTKITLGSWVRRQRTAFRNGTLERERIQRLDSVQGWAWDVLSANWEAAFECLATFVAREGHARVPQTYFDPDTKITLGSWVRRQRRAFRKGTLERERIQRLDSVQGWVWDVRGKN